MSFLLDTNIASDLRKSTPPHRKLREWFDDLSPDELYLSVITPGEIRQGIELVRRRDVRQAQVLGRWLDDLVRFYSDRLLPIDAAVADEWGRLRVVRTVPVIDAMLAATARVHKLTLVTRNDKDVSGLGVSVFNPH